MAIFINNLLLILLYLERLIMSLLLRFKVFTQLCFRTDYNLECSTLIDFTLDMYFASHFFYKQFADTQTQPCSLRIDFLVLIQFHEVHEKILEVSFRDAYSLILDLDGKFQIVVLKLFFFLLTTAVYLKHIVGLNILVKCVDALYFQKDYSNGDLVIIVSKFQRVR